MENQLIVLSARRRNVPGRASTAPFFSAHVWNFGVEVPNFPLSPATQNLRSNTKTDTTGMGAGLVTLRNSFDQFLVKWKRSPWQRNPDVSRRMHEGRVRAHTGPRDV